MCFLVHPAHFTEIQKVCEMLNSESTNILEEEEEENLGTRECLRSNEFLF